MKEKEIVLASFKRTPFTPAHKGELSTLRPDDFAAQLIQSLIQSSGIDPKDLEAIYAGVAFPEAEQGLNIARLLVLLSGLPISMAGATVNQFCGSSMQAIHMATHAISNNSGEAYLCIGLESMTRIPRMLGYNPLFNPLLTESSYNPYISMGETAENVAAEYQISRQRQDEFAYQSQKKATYAQAQGLLSDEIVPILLPSGEYVREDSCIRQNATLEHLSSLAPVFQIGGSVTAGTSSPLTDGASGVLVCSHEFAKKNKLAPLAIIRATAIAGCDPRTMGTGPVFATQKVLERTGLNIDAIDVIELNEAFASQALACMDTLNLLPEKVNLDGGAIAIGHPLGATGARITAKAASLLKRTKGRYAIATQCIGGGQGIATLMESC